MSGAVFLEQRRIDKAGELLPPDSRLDIRTSGRKYVSRGGLKLEGALEKFSISPQGKICADLGSSTGGFTDCLLKQGARKVYAFDVGKGLLDWQLQGNPKIILREKFNVRFLAAEDLPERPELVTVDLSFISLRLILPRLIAACPGADILLLVKPQFEGKPEEVGKGGIITDPEKRLEILERVKLAAEDIGFTTRGGIPSPITGQKGNQEYFLWINSPRPNATD